jgi:ferritin
MVITEKIQDAINQQINAELYSAYLYLSMSAYFETQNLSGFAKWMKGHAQEELTHAMKFYEYVLERMGKMALQAIPAPPAKWDSPVAAFEQVYQHEQKVTALINALLELATTHKDYATCALLQWFVNEQVEEEANTCKMLEKAKLAGASVGALFALDHQAGKGKD